MGSPFCSLSGVKVLSVEEGPGCLQVRPRQWEKERFLLRCQMADFYAQMGEGLEVENVDKEEEQSHEGENKIASSLRQFARLQTSAWVPGRLYAVHRGTGNWSRAAILDPQTGLNVSVWLVDEGKRISVKTHSIFPLASRFTTSQPLSLHVHLYNVSPEDVRDTNSPQTKDMLSLLSRVNEVTLCRRGPPASLSEEHCQAFSLPVDLTWVERVQVDPFLPSQQQEQSLVSALLERGLADVTVDLTLEEEPEEINIAAENEFAHVEPLPSHMTANFRWLDPELPGSQTFYARGTHVDDSGQIWIQPHEGRHNVRLLRRLLNEKFGGSTPNFDPSSNSTSESETESFSDSDKESFGVQQECCVKWRDGNWFRARVIKWLEVEGESRVLVLLVDWGNMYITSPMNLRSTIYGEKIPIQAFSTELYDVNPVDQVWSEECLQHVLDSVLYDKGGAKTHIMRVTPQVEENGMPLSLPLPVSICLPSNLDLSDVLVELGEAQRANLPRQVSMQLQTLRQELEVRVGLLPAGHYPETNAHILLCQPGLEPQLAAPMVKERSKVTSWLCPEENGVLEDEDGPVLDGFRSMDWEKAGVLEPGALLSVQLTEVESLTEVTVIVLPGTSSYLTEMYEELDKGLLQLQSQVKEMPPLLHPRPGLSVAVLWDLREWHRAEVVQCTDTNCFVNFVDFGSKDWAQDSMLVRELPRKWRQVPALSTEVELLVRSMDEEMEPDILQAIMAECLYSKGEEEHYFRVVEVSDRGRLRGHFVDEETGQPLYHGLVKEGLIRLVN